MAVGESLHTGTFKCPKCKLRAYKLRSSTLTHTCRRCKPDSNDSTMGTTMGPTILKDVDNSSNMPDSAIDETVGSAIIKGVDNSSNLSDSAIDSVQMSPPYKPDSCDSTMGTTKGNIMTTNILVDMEYSSNIPDSVIDEIEKKLIEIIGNESPESSSGVVEIERSALGCLECNKKIVKFSNGPSAFAPRASMHVCPSP